MHTQHIMFDGPAGAASLSGELSVPTDANVHIRQHTLVVMVHDIPFSHSRAHHDLFGYLRGLFNEFGFHTVIFDFQSCGESLARPESLTLETARENLSRVLVWAEEQGYEECIFVATGVAAALCLELTNQTTKMVFLFCPVIDLAAHARKTLYADGKVIADHGRKIGGDLIRQMETYDPAPLMKSLKVPVLIQYGTRDEITGPDHVELIKRGFNALRIDITSYDGGDYGLTDPRHRKMMAHHVRSFLEKYA